MKDLHQHFSYFSIIAIYHLGILANVSMLLLGVNSSASESAFLESTSSLTLALLFLLFSGRFILVTSGLANFSQESMNPEWKWVQTYNNDPILVTLDYESTQTIVSASQECPFYAPKLLLGIPSWQPLSLLWFLLFVFSFSCLFSVFLLSLIMTPNEACPSQHLLFHRGLHCLFLLLGL